MKHIKDAIAHAIIALVAVWFFLWGVGSLFGPWFWHHVLRPLLLVLV